MAYLIFCGVGRVCIFLLQKFPFSKLWVVGSWFSQGGFLHDLFECDLCLGVWVFTILSFFFRLNLLDGYFYIPIVSEFITGGITSFLVHLVKLGFEAKFFVIEVK